MASLREFEREAAILRELSRSGRVEVNDLAQSFGVSAVTARKDLENLERRSMLRRVRGGAVSVGTSDEGFFEFRQKVATAAKHAIASHARQFVRPGDVIVLDSSTTCFALAQVVCDIQPLTVVTNGLRTAEYLLANSRAMVIMPGGIIRRASESMVGFFDETLTNRGRIDKGFFGLVGLSTELGLLDLSPEEAQAKAMLAKPCRDVYALFDASKAERFATHPFLAADRVKAMVSDRGVPAEMHRAWTDRGIRWDLVDPKPVTALKGCS